ncbi:MAG TPA: plastocyanin/azurin family copper-binding protein [Ktedonobacterales bacterium]|nr:plastocyanin/azurin family copper-binding protein [Ktedonobacterales bacterium]
MRMFSWLPLLLLSLILLLAGCTQSGPTGNATPTLSPLPTLGAPVDMTGSQHVTIKIINTSTNVSGYWYDQPSIKIKVGTTVTWVNTSDAAHTVTSGQAGTPDGKFDSGMTNLLQPNDQGSASAFAFTFKTPGTYPYYCALHPAMIGQVQVVA